MMSYRFNSVDNILLEYVTSGKIPAVSICVGMNDTVLFQKAYGKLSCEDGAPPCDINTRFDLASLTKCIATGTLVLRAIDEGKLDLQDTLDQFWDVPFDKSGITIQQLMTHTAGFSAGLHLWEETERPENALDVLLQAKLLYQPGTRQLYCCAGFILLGLLLEKLYGLPLDVLCENAVLRPLGMNASSFCPGIGNIAATERQPDGTLLQGIVHDPNARFLHGVSGNAGLFSTSGDVAYYMRMLCRGGQSENGETILSHAVLREAFRNFTPGKTQNRGLAFYLPAHSDGFSGELFPEGTIGHTGFTGTSFALDPQCGLYLVLLTNRVCPSRDNACITRLRRLVHNAVYAAVDPF